MPPLELKTYQPFQFSFHENKSKKKILNKQFYQQSVSLYQNKEKAKIDATQKITPKVLPNVRPSIAAGNNNTKPSNATKQNRMNTFESNIVQLTFVNKGKKKQNNNGGRGIEPLSQ
jgi:hypothetical protein